MLENGGTVRLKLNSVLTKQQPPHSEYVALVTELTALTHALSDMHVCVCMCVREGWCKRLVYCIMCSSPVHPCSCSCCTQLTLSRI